LIIASQHGHLQCVDTLLAAGADPRYANHYGKTALDAAKHFKHTQIVALLKAKIAELDRSA
jgi:ankyrin repeat protein